MSKVVIVGSGPGAVNAAVPLAAAGHEVLMLDFGNDNNHYDALIPDLPFAELRRTDVEQHRYFLGDDFEGIPLGPVRIGAQLTPPRQHVLADAAELQPVASDTFSASTSLAKGGLGAAWSAGVFPFDDAELDPMGLTLRDLESHYAIVAQRIGVSGGGDDLDRLFTGAPSMMPALEIDSNAECISARYEKRRKSLNRAGFSLGRTPLAVCSVAHRGRGPHRYQDLAYWKDLNRSIYRPQWTLADLERHTNFRYLDRRLVLSFSENGAGVCVRATVAGRGEVEEHTADALVLAAGALGSVRIVLRSLERYDTPVPILCNPYVYIPTLNLALVGREVRDRRHSLAQLTAVLQTDGTTPLVQAQVFSYRSLLTFKLMKESPIAFRESLRLTRLLMPYLAILGVHHPDEPSPQKVCVLRRSRDTSTDRLEIDYRPNQEEIRSQRRAERRLVGFFRRLGCWPIKTIRPGNGANMHYAGTLPMQTEGGELTCDLAGRLRGSRAVFVADGSVFPRLPAKGLTFTLMANADRVGKLLAERLR